LAELSGVSPAAYTNKFVYAGGSRIAMRDQTGKLHYFLNDHLGSTRVVLDSTGVVKDKHQYFAFGESWFEETNTNQSYRYTGKPLDSESGLDIYYYGARYYDPELGRFLGIDPLASKYPSWSPYAYAADNPLRNVDPNGKVVETVIDVASVGMSAVDLYNDPSWANAGWLALDVVSAAIPFVPAVGAVRHAAKLGGVVKAIGLTGDASKTAKKIQTVANEAETVVGGAGHVAGSKKHTAFAKGVNDLNQPGLKVEQSFKAGGKAKYGTKGSTRIDAVQYDASGKPTTAYDLKTGNAKLTPARAAEFREATGNLKLEVVEVKPDQP
jgi:RHS repeat-associated protein